MFFETRALGNVLPHGAICLNDPINHTDPLGLKVELVGSEAERVSLFEHIKKFVPDLRWLDVKDKRFLDLPKPKATPLEKDWLGRQKQPELTIEDIMYEIISSPNLVKVKIGETTGYHGPGEFDPKTATVTVAPGSDYGIGGHLFGKPQQITYPMILAHELLGRAYGYITKEGGGRWYDPLERQFIDEFERSKRDNAAVLRADLAWGRVGVTKRGSYTELRWLGSRLYQRYFGVPSLKANIHPELDKPASDALKQ